MTPTSHSTSTIHSPSARVLRAIARGPLSRPPLRSKKQPSRAGRRLDTAAGLHAICDRSAWQRSLSGCPPPLARPVLPSIAILLCFFERLASLVCHRQLSRCVSGLRATFPRAGRPFPRQPLLVANGRLRSRLCSVSPPSLELAWLSSWRRSQVAHDAVQRASGGITCGRKKLGFNKHDGMQMQCYPLYN